MKTINLSFSWADASVSHEGSVIMEVSGRSTGGQGYRIKLTMGPSGIGHIGERLHKALHQYEERLAISRKRLKGE